MSETSEHQSFVSGGSLFKRDPENLLMLEQLLSDLDARYVYLADLPSTEPGKVTEEIEAVLQRYRAYQRDKASGRKGAMPDWPDAFRVEQLLSRLMPQQEAQPELVRQLAALQAIDPGAHAGLSADWDAATKDAGQLDARTRQILVATQRAVQWKNTQRWIIRTLGLLYASRLQQAFMIALGIGIVMIFADAYLGRGLQRASLSGIGFAAAAGLIGASFSAMVGQGRVVALDNIEEARAATSRQMIALRLGVGVAAALILYFFFEAGMIDGALFPNLEQIGFGYVQPDAGDDAVSAFMTALGANGPLHREEIAAAQGNIDALLAVLKESPEVIDAALAERLEDARVAMVTLGEKVDFIRMQSSALPQPLGRLAPNADLSKLVVWSFAAGFVQTLVPALLAKVEPVVPPK